MSALNGFSREDVTEMLARCRAWCPALFKRLWLRNRDGRIDLFEVLMNRCRRGYGSGRSYFWRRAIQCDVFDRHVELRLCIRQSTERLAAGSAGSMGCFYRFDAWYIGRKGANSVTVLYWRDLVTTRFHLSDCWFDGKAARVDLLLPVCRRLYQSMIKRFYRTLEQVRIVCVGHQVCSSDIHLLITRYLSAYSKNPLASTSASWTVVRPRQRRVVGPGSSR